VSTCFTVLRQLRTIRCSVSRSVIQSLAMSLVLSSLDYGNATLAGIRQHLLWRLQSVTNAAARLVVYSSSKCVPITPLLRQLHWLKAKERIDIKLTVLVYKYKHGTASTYLADELSRSTDSQARCRLCLALSSSLVVRRTHLSTVGDRSFLVTASCVWKGLPHYVTAAPSLTVLRLTCPLVHFVGGQ